MHRTVTQPFVLAEHRQIAAPDAIEAGAGSDPEVAFAIDQRRLDEIVGKTTAGVDGRKLAAIKLKQALAQ